MNNNDIAKTTSTTHALPRASFLAAASLLVPFTWTPPQASAIDVTSGTNLQTIVNNTNRNATFDLKGEVKWGNALGGGGNAISSGASNIVINSNGHIIKQNDNGAWLDYKSGSGSSHFFTLKNTWVQGDQAYYTGLYGLFHGDNFSTTITLKLEGSTFDSFHGRGDLRSGTIGLSYYKSALVVDGGTSGVTFSNNKGAEDHYDGAGVFGTFGNNSSLTLKGNTSFTGNSTTNHGGALTIYAENTSSSTTLLVNSGNDGKAVFTGNSAGGFGGAINFWGYTTESTFGGEAEFTNNWTHGSGSGISNRAKRGGAINVGVENGQSNIVFKEKVTFTGNRAIGILATDLSAQAWGGALSLTAQGTNLGTTDGKYTVTFDKAAVFRDNYAVSSATATTNKFGYGGAVYVGTGTATNTKSVTFGAGSLFERNLAQTKGGAIYVSAIDKTDNSGGIITLNADNTGDITFMDNYDGVAFTAVNATNYQGTSGTRNAIHFAGNGTLNINATGTGKVHFHDPITGGQTSLQDTKSLVTVKKTGDGDVIFYGNKSDIYARTTVSGGKFVLKNGAEYGAPVILGNGTSFDVSGNAILAAERGTLINANSFWLKNTATLQLLADGRTDGKFTINVNSPFRGGEFSPDATFIFEIKGADAPSRNAGKLGFANTTPTFGSTPAPKLKFDTSQWTENLSNLSNQDYVSITLIEKFGYNGAFQNGSVIAPSVFGLTDADMEMNGGKFQFEYANNNLYLNQFDAYPIPEPSTYALLGGIGAVALAVMRRKKRRA
ncbi:MAG: PEP-CTERM sorting domain-containing protein [Puniceicoccales bacterium]|nr:PEP-CTERM sorting domain-containing protein [Puniceicoccales bacterium]